MRLSSTGSAPPTDAGGPKVTAATFLGTGGINGVRLTFDEPVVAASVDLGDAMLATPTGSVSPTAVTVDGTLVTFTFPNHTTMGDYTLTVGPGVRDDVGNPMNQDSDATNGEVPSDQYTAITTVAASRTFHSTDVNKPIADVARTVSVLNVGRASIIRDINVEFNIQHTFDSDLRITLIAPDGTQVLLVNQRGGSGDNFTNTGLDDASPQTISQGSAPFNSIYQPEVAVSTLNGKVANGQWRLVIDDLARQNSGWLNSWSLTIF